MSKMYKALAKAKEERELSFVNHLSEDRGALILLDRRGRDEGKRTEPMDIGEQTDRVSPIR